MSVTHTKLVALLRDKEYKHNWTSIFILRSSAQALETNGKKKQNETSAISNWVFVQWQCIRISNCEDDIGHSDDDRTKVVSKLFSFMCILSAIFSC